jgi:hypothetical protein
VGAFLGPRKTRKDTKGSAVFPWQRTARHGTVRNPESPPDVAELELPDDSVALTAKACMSDQQPPKLPMEKFTIAGRLLIIATIVFAGGFFYWNVIFINDNFPAGHYPIVFIAIPVLIGSAIFYGVGCLTFKLFGIRVEKDSHNDKPAA